MFLSPLLLLLLLTGNAAEVSAHSLHEQTFFQLESPFTHPEPLPHAAVEKIRGTIVDNSCRNEESIKNMNPDWFVASQVTLNPGEPRAWVVKARKACLNGANIGPFWIVQQMGRDYEILLNESALALEVQTARSNNYRDIELSAAVSAGRYIVSLRYKFKDGKYRLFSRRTTRNTG